MAKYNIREFLANKEYNLRNADPARRLLFEEEIVVMGEIQEWLKRAGERQQFRIRRIQAYAGGNYCLELMNDSGFSFQTFSLKVTLYQGNRPVYETWAKTGSWDNGTMGQLIFAAPDAPYTSFTLDTKDVTYERISGRPRTGTQQGGSRPEGSSGEWKQGTGSGQTTQQQSMGTGSTTYPKQPIPAVFIILAFIFFWPLGIFLLIRRISDSYVTESNTDEYYEINEPPKKQPNDALLTVGWIIAYLVSFWQFVDIMPRIPYVTVEQILDEICVIVAGLVIGTVLLVYQQRTRSKYRRYDLIINDEAPTVSLDYIAESYPADYQKVCSDLQKMLSRGYYGEAFLDFQGRQLVFPQNGGERAKEPALSPLEKKQRAKAAQDYLDRLKNNPDSKEARIKTINDCKALVDDEEFKKKLDRLAKLTEQIHDRMEEKPQKKNEVDRFMNKYLPLILKGIDTYADLVKKDIPGQEVQDLKKQLEQSLDNFIQAFENVLSRLYVDDVMDVSTDLTAIEGALAGEGLLDDHSEILRGTIDESAMAKIIAEDKTEELKQDPALEPEKAEAAPEPKE